MATPAVTGGGTRRGGFSTMMLTGMTELFAGVVTGTIADSVFPPASQHASRGTEFLEVLGQAALDSVVANQVGGLFELLDPGNINGGVMFYMGFILGQPNFGAKVKHQGLLLHKGILDVLGPALTSGVGGGASGGEGASRP